jgi:1-acyl-sn-glycerol-3-phosphate acyltransferase
MRWIIGLALGFYFRRIERFHAGRVPESGPVLFASNHPNSLTDSFIIGTSVARKVNFVGTVQLFRFPPLKWFLGRCGVIAINRLKDNPRAMRTVSDTFEACYRALEKGEAVGIFPEGVTYDDSQLKEIKSGAARMALELEERHQGRLGLRIVPTGLTYSAKELYRSEVLVNFGEPIRASDYLEDYAAHRKGCILKLTADLEKRIQSLILHTPELEQARVVAAVKRMYFDRRTGESAPTRADELVRDQRVAEVVAEVFRQEPMAAAAFARRLALYERWRDRLRLGERGLASAVEKRRFVGRTIGWACLALIAAPVALYGWVHRLAPYAVVRWAVAKFVEPGKKKAQASTVALIAGAVSFTFAYGVYVSIFHAFFGLRATLWYALSLPVTGLIAHYYVRRLKSLLAETRDMVILLRAPATRRRLLAMRAGLIAEIESVHGRIGSGKSQTLGHSEIH